MKLQKFLEIANKVEQENLGWFTRCGMTGEDAMIAFRMSHGNDPTPYVNARQTEQELLKHKIRSVTDFAVTQGTLKMYVKKIYPKHGAEQ